jgi:hypothetical protein
VPEDQWETQGPYTVKITIPTDSKTAEFYYFCHIHPGGGRSPRLPGVRWG